MSSLNSDTLKCRLKFLNICDFTVDENFNLTYVGKIKNSTIVLPYGLNGLVGTGFSGLPIEVLKFNKDLVNFEVTALSNCSMLREIFVYEHQLDLIKDLKFLYPSLVVNIRKGVVV